MTKKTKWLLFVLIFVMFSYFWWRGAVFLDPDFGWHLTMGQFILKEGIPSTDPFSYTMSSYPFVDHEWLTNVFFARVMDATSYPFLAGIFALFALVAFSLPLLTISEKGKKYALPFFFLVFLAISGFIGIRPQIITWLFFSVLLFVLRDFVRFEKYRWFLPLFFVLWVNLHGGFAVGIVALFVATVYWWFKKPAQKFFTLGIFVACIAATLVMPYGFRGWWEVWMQMTDGNLRWMIMEWTPTVFVPSIQLWLFIVFSVMFVGRYHKKFSLLDLLLYGGLLLAALSSIRHAPLWLLIALPLTIEAVAFFYQDITKIKYAVRRFNKMATVFVGVICLLVLFDIQNMLYGFGVFGKQSMYPEHAVAYLRTHLPKGNVFATYDWGGYLIWKFPEKKVFIDGRMPSWRWHANIVGESNYAFEEYRSILDGKSDFTKVRKQYDIDTLLLPVQKDQKQDPISAYITKFGREVLHLPLRKEEGLTKFLRELKKTGWVVVYQDDTAVIYLKK